MSKIFGGHEEEMAALAEQDASITPNEMVAAIQRQAAELGQVGEIGLFGDARTVDDIALALERLAQVAAGYAARIRAGRHG